jgi:hypothetical protein
MSQQAQLLLLWAVCSLIAALAALQFTRAAYEDEAGVWVPVSNDSFYHARRILDAAETPEGLYQFDEKIHAPEGSWVNWPWAYDWAMAKALQGWKELNPDADSMAFLTHVPVYWVFVTAALLLGICIVIGLSVPWTALVMFGYALSPLTMQLHGVGFIDHHYIEYTFVLLTLFTGIYWLNQPEKSVRAALLGITLGCAPAFHTGLFILQAPVLLVLVILWIRHSTPGKDALLTLSSTLILSTLLILIPSEPFRDSQFQFSVLSWFHLYIAAVSTLLIAGLARFEFTTKKLLGLLAIGLTLLIPIWKDTLSGSAFLSGEIILLDKIPEAYSPFRLALEPGGIIEMLNYYSLFGLLAPLLIVLYLWRGWTAKDGATLFFSVMTLFGLTLLFTQFRLHYFGSFALILGWAVLANEKLSIVQRKPLLSFLVGLIILAGAFSLGINNKMMVKYALGLDPAYEDTFQLFGTLEKACDRNPGIVFTNNNFGHYARFHSSCSVIANNFLMTPLHEQKIRQMQALIQLSPEEFLIQAPADVRYIFARLEKFFVLDDKGALALGDTEFLRGNNARLFFELNTRADLPPQYKVIAELPLESGMRMQDDRGFGRARLVEVLPTN